jgi:4,5-dihydroxyphthalate decarboxylase
MAEASRFVKQHGYVPANHAYAIRGDIARQYPWLAFNLYKAFVAAKQMYRDRLSESLPSGLFFGREYLAQTKEILGDDPFSYGIKANRPMLETIIDYSHEQGLIPQKPKIEELFAPATLDL